MIKFLACKTRRNQNLNQLESGPFLQSHFFISFFKYFQGKISTIRFILKMLKPFFIICTWRHKRFKDFHFHPGSPICLRLFSANCFPSNSILFNIKKSKTILFLELKLNPCVKDWSWWHHENIKESIFNQVNDGDCEKLKLLKLG